jgi:hypothetical protein
VITGVEQVDEPTYRRRAAPTKLMPFTRRFNMPQLRPLLARYARLFAPGPHMLLSALRC